MNPNRPRRPRSPGPRRSAFLAVWLLLMAVLIIGPFALAGRTGNPLWIAAPVAATLVFVALKEAPRCLAYYRSLWPRAWLPALGAALAALTLTVSVAGALSLLPSDQPLNGSLGTLFAVGSDAGANGFAIPLATPWLAIIYAPAALLALPLLAWWEEDIFRRGTAGMVSALKRNSLFGLLHITAGVSLGVCVALGCAGFVFTLVYWRALRDPDAGACRESLPPTVAARLLPLTAGRAAAEQYAVYRATQAHLVYNAIGVTAILISSFVPSHF